MSDEKNWKDVAADSAVAQKIAKSTGVPLPIATILVARGLTDEKSAESFLNPRLSDLSDPFLLPDMAEAVQRLKRALLNHERITVFGDFDCDGVTASAVLVTVLRQLDADVVGFLPRRMEEGYGFTVPALERCMAARKPDLVITVDCGTSSVEAADVARDAGIDVIVTDHHDISGDMADVVALVNPKRGDNEPNKLLAGVGVAFKLCHALVKDGVNRDDGPPAVDLREVLDVVAVGTVADVVPLVDENRILVKHGLHRINTSPSVGLAALADVAGIDSKMGCYHLGFLIGPRLNAAGRLGEAGEALDLLLAPDRATAMPLARRLDAANRERKRIEDEILVDATQDIEKRFDATLTFGLVTGQEGWHIGTVGIVASRLCSRFHRPTIVVGFNSEGTGRGSCRSIEGLNMVDVLQDCSDLLEKFGGHEMAAGITLKTENLAAFRRRFNDACRERLSGTNLDPVHHVDAWISLGEADATLWEGIERLAPVGAGNPTPLWGIRDVQPVGTPRIVGKNHLRMMVGQGGTQIDCIGFGLGELAVPSGRLDVLAQLKENTYGRRRSLQLNLKDFRPSDA